MQNYLRTCQNHVPFQQGEKKLNEIIVYNDEYRKLNWYCVWMIFCTHFNFCSAVVLWSGCFCTWVIFLTRERVNPRTWTDCKLYYFIFYFGRHYSSMLLVLMSLEKCFAVYFPFKSKTVCTVKTAKWATGIVAIILAGYNMKYFFLLESYFSKYYGSIVICVTSVDREKISFLYPVDSVLYSFAPFVLMFTTNFAIIFKFMTAKCYNNSTDSTNQALVKSATRGTAMVVTVSVTFIILTAPTAASAALWNVFRISKNPLYRAFMNTTQYLNHSINGVLYCIVGTKFRKELLKIFCRKKIPDPTSISHSVTNTSPTTISGSRV